MKTTATTFRMDAGLKMKAEKALDEIGLSMSSAFAKAIVRIGAVPFDLTIDPFYQMEHQDELTRRIELYESGEAEMVDMTEEF